MEHRIPDATENLRSSVKRLYKPDIKYGIDDAALKRFIDGGHLSDDDKSTLTNHLFPHLAFDPIKDRLISKPATYATQQATAYLRRLTQDYPDKVELTRKTRINPNLIDHFVSGSKDLSSEQKQELVTVLGIRRNYDAKTDRLVPITSTAKPSVTPPPCEGQDWRKQQARTLGTVD